MQHQKSQNWIDTGRLWWPWIQITGFIIGGLGMVLTLWLNAHYVTASEYRDTQSDVRQRVEKTSNRLSGVEAQIDDIQKLMQSMDAKLDRLIEHTEKRSK